MIDTECFLCWPCPDQSNATLRKADTEYKGQRSILSVTRSKITSLTRQDLIDRYNALFFVLMFVLVHMIVVRSNNLFLSISTGITSSYHS